MGVRLSILGLASIFISYGIFGLTTFQSFIFVYGDKINSLSSPINFISSQ